MKAKGEGDRCNMQGLVLTDNMRCSLEASAQVKYYTRHYEQGLWRFHSIVGYPQVPTAYG